MRTEQLASSSQISLLWPMEPLGVRAVKIQDGTHFSPKTTEGPCRYLTSKNVRFGYLDIEDSGWISKEEHRAIYSRCDVRQGDVLLTKDGANTGNAAINTLDEEFSLLSSVAIIRCDEQSLVGRYVLQYLLSEQGQRRLKDEMSGNAITRLTLQKIKAFEIPVPPPNQQHRIADILDAADAVIRKSEAVIAKLRRVKDGVLHDLLTRGLDDQGQLRDPVAHPEQFKDSPFGRIPKEWEVAELNHVAEVDRGKFTHRPRNAPAFYGGDYPFIQTGDVALAAGEVLFSYGQTLNQKGRAVSREFPIGSIAITIAANIADTAILGIPMYFPDSIVAAVVRTPNNNRFVELCIRIAKPRLESRAPQSAQRNINLTDLRTLLVPIPTPSEENRIAAMYEAHDSRIQSEVAYLDKLQLQKRGLMHDLLTGRVCV